MRYGIWTSPDKGLLLKVTKPDGDVLRLEMTFDQARELIRLLDQAITLGPQMAAPN